MIGWCASLAVVALSIGTAMASDARDTKLTAKDLDSPAAAAVRKVPVDVLRLGKPKRFSLEAKREEEEALLRPTEEIRVFGLRDPDDVVAAKKPPMLAFRERLERDRPMTPAEKARVALCLIGLCATDYGPEGIPVETTSHTRGERGAGKTSLELSRQFRGTVQ